MELKILNKQGKASTKTFKASKRPINRRSVSIVFYSSSEWVKK